MKKTKVIPLFKSGNKMLLNNYRPASVLPLFSKILEHLVYNRVLSFIQKHNILYSNQFGFRKNYSTNMALIMLIDKIMSHINNGDLVIGIFIDLTKAFDTVNHDILLQKLCKYGIRGLPLIWFESYLKNREQCVFYNNEISSEQTTLCGIPQGSILGPLLFLLYINDIINVSTLWYIILFADDTSLFSHGKNIDLLINNLNTELVKLSQWLNSNKLTINVKKLIL